jgi:hypothetical protein
MPEVNWNEIGAFVGRDLAGRGGTALLDNIDTIGIGPAIKWLDGVLDGLREGGIEAKSIAISGEVFKDFTEATGSEGEAYRGILLMEVNDAGPRPVIVVAA